MELCDTRACESTEIAVGGHTGTVHSIAWSPDVTQFFSVGQDDYLRRWRASDGQLLDEMQIFFPLGLKSVAWSPNRLYLALGGDEDSTVTVSELYH